MRADCAPTNAWPSSISRASRFDREAVLYYDIARNDDSPGIPTDVYLPDSSNGGGTWSAPLLVTSFDLSTATVARGLFVGDYMGLEAIGARGVVGFLGVTDGTPHSANVLSVRFNR